MRAPESWVTETARVNVTAWASVSESWAAARANVTAWVSVSETTKTAKAREWATTRATARVTETETETVNLRV
jgi:hypothetical protein